MACPQCAASQQQNLDSCGHCGATLVTIPELAPAKQLLAARRAAEALPLLADIAKQHPTCAECRLLLGAAFSAAGRGQEAVGQFEEAVRLAVANAPYRYNLALAYRAAGRLEDARQQLQFALQIDPNYEKARTALASLPAAPGQPPLAPAQPQAAGGMRTLDDQPQGGMRTLGNETAPDRPAAPAIRPLGDDSGGMGQSDQPVMRAAEEPTARPLGAAPAATDMPSERTAPAAATPRPPGEEEVTAAFRPNPGIAALVSAGAGLAGGLMVMAAFRMLISPEAVSGGDAFVTFGARGALLVALIAGLTAGCFSVPGIPRAGALGGLVAGAIGFMVGAVSLGSKPPPQIVLGTALAGVIIGALAEQVTKVEVMAGKRAFLLVAVLLVSAGWAGKQFINLGVVVGRVYYCPYSEVETGVRLALPGAEVTVWSEDGTTPLYRTTSIRSEGKAPGASTLAGDNGMYYIHNIPKGRYKISVVRPDTRESSDKGGLGVDKTRMQDPIKRDLFIQQAAPPPAKITPAPIPEEFREKMSPQFLPPNQQPGTTAVPTPGGTIHVPTEAPSTMDEGDW